MISVNLTKIKTSDGLILEGIVVEPKPKSGAALIWLHGLGSRFSSGQPLVAELSDACRKAGIGYFKFNMRGHDIASYSDIGVIGAGFEKFEDCILDIRAMVRFAKKLGYRRITLVGNSTGANKALYYCYKTKDRSVKGLALLGPVSDVPVQKHKLGVKKWQASLTVARKLAGKKDALMPLAYGVSTPKRYLSLFQPSSAEDVFPYHNPSAKWKELASIKIPIAVIIGSRDEHLDIPLNKFIQAFHDHAPLTNLFKCIIIQNANHGFKGKEKILAESLVEWLQQNGL